MNKIQQMLEDIGYHVETNGPGIYTMEKSMPEATKDNPWPMICVTSTGGSDLPPDEGPFLIGHYNNDCEAKVHIELGGPEAAELIVPILRTLELNRPK